MSLWGFGISVVNGVGEKIDARVKQGEIDHGSAPRSDHGRAVSADAGRWPCVRASSRRGGLREQSQSKTLQYARTSGRASPGQTAGLVARGNGVSLSARAEFDLRVADVAVVSQTRSRAIDPEDNLRGAPELVIEVKSPSNTPRQLRELASLCLANGGVEFWVVDLEHAAVTVIHQDGSSSHLAGGQKHISDTIRRGRPAGRRNLRLIILAPTSKLVERQFHAPRLPAGAAGAASGCRVAGFSRILKAREGGKYGESGLVTMLRRGEHPRQA